MVKGFTVDFLSNNFADIFLAYENRNELDYRYGGTRMITSTTSDYEVRDELIRLMSDESGLKNQLINIALRNHVLDEDLEIMSEIPDGFLKSSVGGGRCIIRPKTKEYEYILANPNAPDFIKVVSPIFQSIGEYLNKHEGYLKLTPDFGRFAGLADLLNRFTDHSLGICCEKGGCGGKSSYSTTGIIAAFQAIEQMQGKDYNKVPITLVGTAGAMGSEFLEYADTRPFEDIVVCDLQYDKGKCKMPQYETYPAQNGKFTDECLARGGIIVATTLGRELESSNWDKLSPGTVFLLAHNLAIPAGYPGIQLMRKIKEKNVIAIPGQILTLGGALTSRLEWFWRQSTGTPFNKPLAHKVVRRVISYLIVQVLYISKKQIYRRMKLCLN